MTTHGKPVSGYHVALYTFGQFLVPAKDPANDGFYDREPLNFDAVANSHGFIARSGYPDEPGPESWGPQVFPRFYEDNGDGFAPSTLSIWESLEAIHAFAYSGIHAEALKLGRKWFRKPQWPPYVLWWLPTGQKPDWSQGTKKLEWLHDHGADATAFDFKTPFASDGKLGTLDRALIKCIAAANANGT
jgi:hypothetical protein